MTVNDKIFLALTPSGGSGVYGRVTGFTTKYGMAYVIIQTPKGKGYSAPVDHAFPA